MASKTYNVLFIVAMLLLSSCSVFRGLALDGPSGPDIYEYQKLERDTIFKGDNPFHFPLAASHRCIDRSMHITYKKAGNIGKVRIDSLVEQWFGKDGQLLIIHNDSVVYDQWTEPFYPGKNATIFSVSKSLTGLLCGIAVDEGYIKGVDDPVTDYIPELAQYNATFKKLRIVHLLNMQAGFDFYEDYELTLKGLFKIFKITQLQYGHDFTRLFRHIKFKSQPGEKYEYNSLTTALLSWIIERATGKTYADYMSEKVWKPLGMERDAWVTIDSRKHHHTQGFGGIATNVYDLAKIGRLYLNGGTWNGKQIVSKEWIDRSLEKTTKNKGYHYCWYHQYHDDDAGNPSFYAFGVGHQFIYINQKKNVIIARIGNNYNWMGWEMSFFDSLCDKLF